MVDINDRRQYAGDFNGPGGHFTVTSHGYAEEDRWAEMSHKEARPEVHKYYSGQKNTAAWREANRLAKQRTDAQFRRATSSSPHVEPTTLPGHHYAQAYQENLVRVMATKGRGFAEAAGELAPRHPQSGYGRT